MISRSTRRAAASHRGFADLDRLIGATRDHHGPFVDDVGPIDAIGCAIVEVVDHLRRQKKGHSRNDGGTVAQRRTPVP